MSKKMDISVHLKGVRKTYCSEKTTPQMKAEVFYIGNHSQKFVSVHSIHPERSSGQLHSQNRAFFSLEDILILPTPLR